MSTPKGFTIVELLIVVVVIAILAAITIVAYNGIQARAHAASAAQARSSVEKLLRLYKVENGRYPIPSVSGATVCIGDASQYLASGVFASGRCVYSNYTGTTTSHDATISNELKALGGLPSINWPVASETHSPTQKDFYRGLFYNAGFFANNGASAFLWYYLPFQATCPSNGYGSYDSSTGETQCTISLE